MISFDREDFVWIPCVSYYSETKKINDFFISKFHFYEMELLIFFGYWTIKKKKKVPKRFFLKDENKN